MQFQKYLTTLILLITTMVFSQEKMAHKVVKGESVYSIAQKYNVKPNEILDLNPKAKKTLQLNMVLIIPSKGSQINSVVVSHEVQAKETLYGLSKKYNTSIEEIKKANPIIEDEGLKLGTLLSIPASNKTVITEKVTKTQEVEKKPEIVAIKQAEETSNELVFHTVSPKETKYGISRKYRISIDELESLNPEIKNGLPIGFKLKLNRDAEHEIETSGEKISKIDSDIVNEEITEESKSQFKIIKKIESDKNSEITQNEEEQDANDNSELIQTDMPLTVVEPLTPENMTKAEFLIEKASENLGARYRSGATGNGAFDCSGLVFATFKNIDLILPRSSRDMAKFGSKIDKTQAQKGDLIFFATRGNGISHVGMVTEVNDDEIKFIHSSTSSGVIYSSTKESYYSKRFVQVNRVLN